MLGLLRTNWHAMRIVRVVLGVFAGIEYLSIHDPLLLMVGGIFLIQGLFNVGCCGAGACEWSPDGKKSCDNK